MRLLEAVNLILVRVGEHPVTSTTVKHPTLAVLLPEIDLELVTLLNKGWWFNEYDYTAYPDSEKKITLGTECLSFVPECAHAALRGQDLYNTSTRTYLWDAPVKGRLIEHVEFHRLPESAAQYVMYMAAVNTHILDIGKTNEVEEWKVKAAAAYDTLLSEHLRNKRYNSRNLRTFQRIIRHIKGY